MFQVITNKARQATGIREVLYRKSASRNGTLLNAFVLKFILFIQ